MDTQHLINIAATSCPPETDQAFNKWYDEEHIPLNMKFKGMEGATRYKLACFTGDATVEDYPVYIAVYRFKDYDTFEKWNASPELKEARKNYDAVCGKGGVELFWRVQYNSIRSWKDTSPMSVITMVGVDCPPEYEKKFDTWYSETHIPGLLKYPGLQGITRYRLAGFGDHGTKATRPIKVKSYPKFLTFYYFKNIADSEGYDTSPARMAARGDWKRIQKETSTSHLWRARYLPLRTWQR